MRRIKTLTFAEKRTLEEGFLKSSKAHFRRRCHSILLSYEGYKVSEIASLYKVRTRTIYTWFNRWESNGILGLILLPGRGLKAKLDQLSDEQLVVLKKEVKSNAQNLTRVCQRLSDIFGFSISKKMLIRLLKKNSITLGEGLESA